MIPLLALGLYGAALKKNYDDGEVRRADEQAERDEKKRVRDEDAAIREMSKVAPVEQAQPFDGVGPAAFMGAGQAFGTQQQALNAVNDAAMVKRIGALNHYGRTDEAVKASTGLSDLQTKRRELAEKIKNEGAVGFLESNFAQAPSVADIESGKVKDFALQGIKEFNATGSETIPEGARGQWRVLDLGNGRKQADFVAVGPDGKQLGTMTGRTMLAVHGMTQKEREALDDSRFRDDRDFKLKKDLTNAQIDYYRDRGDAAITRANGAGGGSGGGKGGGGGSAYERMSEFERKQYEAAHRDLLDLQGKLRGAKAGADYNPDSRGIRDLEEESALLRDQILRLEKKYGEGSGAPKSDLGLMRPGAGKPAPASAGVKDPVPSGRAPEGSLSGAAVLQEEYGGDVGVARADVAELQQELKRKITPEARTALQVRLTAALEAVKAGERGGAKPTPATQATPAPARRPVTPSPAAQGVGPSAANLAPTQDKVANGIQAENIQALNGLKAQVAQAEAQMAAAAKSGDPKALQAYATRLTQARAALATEAERRLGNNAPVYLAQR